MTNLSIPYFYLYIPHGHCYLWQTPLVSLHLVSDALITIAYFSIPAMLIYFVKKREDTPFSKVFILFSAFIICCGVGHLLEIWTLWHPNYWLSGIEQAITALVSCYTALQLSQLLPQFLALRSPEELEKLNQELEQRVAERTNELQQKNQTLQNTLQELKKTQAQLIQTEKMSSLGQLVAGVAHEINNPVSFIHGNLEYASSYCHELSTLAKLYRAEYPQSTPKIQNYLIEIDFDFLAEDIEHLLESMRVGTKRILEIVKSLRIFSRLDEAQIKQVDLHEGIDSTLMILQHRLQNASKSLPIEVIKEYSSLPKVNCYPSQINQVFMNLLSNAIDAIIEAQNQRSPAEIQDNPSRIWIRTEIRDREFIIITIEDNGIGISPETQAKIFDPFFTTKKIGQGTGLGLSISHQIITEMHQGQLICHSRPGCGTELIVQLPVSSSRSIS